MIKRALILCFLLGCDGSLDPHMPTPVMDAGAETQPVVPGLCQLTAMDKKVGIGLSECQASDLTTLVKYGAICYKCFAEFVTPAEGCYTYPGTTTSRLCVLDCGICD
jgi:hypothetical protein